MKILSITVIRFEDAPKHFREDFGDHGVENVYQIKCGDNVQYSLIGDDITGIVDEMLS